MSSTIGAGPVTVEPITPAGTDLASTSPASSRSRMLQVPKSTKIRLGLGLALLFTFLAIIGPWIAPFDPNKSLVTNIGIPQPPSAHNLLGTTQVQQDVLSQLLTGGRSTIVVALIAGVVATALAVVFGVMAGYYGGLMDDLLS